MGVPGRLPGEVMADELAPAPLNQAQPLQAPEPSVLDKLAWAVFGQESNHGQNVQTSPTGARGPMQIEPETFARFASPSEEIDNYQDNLTVGRRMLGHYLQTYGDPARAAVAYYSGEGNVAPPGSPTPWIHNVSGGGGPPVSTYVAQVGQRMGNQNMVGMGLMGLLMQRDLGQPPEGPSLLDTTLEFGQDLSKAKGAAASPAAGAAAKVPQVPRVPVQTPTINPVMPAQPIRATRPLEVYQALMQRQNPLVSNG